MDGVARRRLTDAVTVSRVPIALAMLLLPQRRAAVAWLFVVGVATDLLDGPLARRLGTDSARGARLDSGADAVFVAASAIAVVATLDAASRRIVGRAAGVVGATRLTTLLLTRQRFGTWSVVHTRLNKATGLGLATVTAIALVRRRTPLGALGAIAVLAEVAAIEELAIVVATDEYDADRASLLDRSDGAPARRSVPERSSAGVGTAGIDNLDCRRSPR
jgi:CDP-diacylglycerol---glycerol-3-phosphate 3-phosphatidyltransferase